MLSGLRAGGSGWNFWDGMIGLIERVGCGNVGVDVVKSYKLKCTKNIRL